MVNQLKTLEEFEECIKNNKYVVVDFTATWCPPCQMIGPKFVAMAGEAEFQGATFIKIDVDENEETS